MNLDEKQLRCSICGKMFTDDNSLADHMTLHAGLRCLTCDVCEMMFQKQSQLEEHEKVHRHEKPFICSKCEKTFASRSTLHVHERIHTGKKPYPCDERGQCFTQNCTLKRHQMSDTGEKPFSCDECGKRFTKKSNMRQHETTHTDESPFIFDCKVRNKSSFWRPFENRSHEDLLKNTLKKEVDVKNLFPATSKTSEDGNRDCNIPPAELNYHKGIHMHDSVAQYQNTDKRNMSQNDSLTNRNEIIFIKRNGQTHLHSSTVADVSNPTRELYSNLSTDRQFNNLLRYRDQNICVNNESDIKKLKLAPSQLKGSLLNPYHEVLSQQDASLPQKNIISEASRY